MSTEPREIKAQGSTVEGAIASGLAILGLSKDQVTIEIIDEGRKGLLGIGGRDAVVRLQVIAPVSPMETAVQPPVVKTPPPPPKSSKPPERQAKTAPPPVTKTAPPAVKPTSGGEPAADGDEDSSVPVEIVTELLGLMQVNAEVNARLTEPDDLTGKRMTIVDITGDDLGLLIGPRGETLDALQYISRLMVGHKTHQRAHFIIDIEGYRERREQALARLAERMAQKAVKRGEAVTLEPMPAHERRIIHMALRNSPDVKTESTGEGNRRRVRIYPK